MMNKRTWKWYIALLLVLAAGCKPVLTEEEYWPEAAKLDKAYVVTFYPDQAYWSGPALDAYYWPSDSPLPVPAIDSSSYYYSYSTWANSNWVTRHFHHWNTAPGGNGTSYYPGESITGVATSLDLYAICQ